MIGRTLAHYTVIAKIGEGGMGEVYRARDTRLHREAAIKVLPVRFTEDAERLARFEREARVLASLNHPNIAAIHGLEEHEGVRFLAMELAQGQDLEKRITSGPLPMEECLSIARQVAGALEAAHGQGVVHRDLKPGNVMVAGDGTVKVLDFGLAKALDPIDPAGSDARGLTQSPTLLNPTGGAVILGTAAYMSPEQAKGGAVDHRTDIWAFGCLLYECLTGKQAFHGDSISDTLAAVLRDTIDWAALPAATPPAIRRLLRRCLERDAARRLHSMADARLEIEEAAGEAPEERPGVPVASPRPSVLRFLWPLLVLMGAAVAAGIVWVLKPGPATPVVRFTLTADSLAAGSLVPPVISADGTRIAYGAAGRLWIRRLDTLEPREVAGSRDARHPFWSPDGSQLGFEARNRLWRVSVSGGDPVVITDLSESFGKAAKINWGSDDRIIYGSGNGGIHEISASGGSPRILVEPVPGADVDFHEPGLLPNGDIVFVTHSLVAGTRQVEVFTGGQRKVIWTEEMNGAIASPVYSLSGHLLLNRSLPNPGLWALPFSLDRLEVTGEPVLVADLGEVPSLSRDGTLVYTPGNRTRHQIVRVVRGGTGFEALGEPFDHVDDVGLSGDGTRLLASFDDGKNSGIGILDLERGMLSRLPSRKGSSPFWMPGYRELGAVWPDSNLIYVAQANGGADERTLVRGADKFIIDTGRSVVHPSPDGRFVVFSATTVSGKEDIWVAPMDGSAPPASLVAMPFREFDPRFSPDGSLLAYTSNRSGRQEIYISRFSEGKLSEGVWQVSSDGGESPRWSGDGTGIIYASNNRLMEVAVSSGEGIRLGRPENFLGTVSFSMELEHGFDVDAEDRAYVILVGRLGETTSRVIVVQNWSQELPGKR